MESPWLRHPKVWWLIGVIGFAITGWVLIENRAPPSYIGTQYFVPQVVAGQRAPIVVPVKRSLNRECSVDYSRVFINSEHSRMQPASRGHVSAEGLDAREKETPGQLVLDVLVPAGAPLGLGEFETENQYFCPFNPTTWIKPIEDRWTYKVNVVKAPQ